MMDLDKVYGLLTIDDRTIMRNQMTDFYSLKVALDQCENTDEILQYLAVEARGAKRASFITRIIGRYKKDKYAEIDKELRAWVSKKTS